MQSEDFAAGLARLGQLATRRPTAIMWGEAVPWRCHLLAPKVLPEGIGEDATVALSRPVRDVFDEAMALVFGAELNAWEGKHDEAARMYEQGIRVAREHGVLMPALEGMFMAGVNLTGRGDCLRIPQAFCPDRRQSVVAASVGVRRPRPQGTPPEQAGCAR